jgi:NADPH:quinone reductase-like Zn-dependent oxidoreductase
MRVQIAKALGAYVIGTASADKHELVRGLGADELIDYRAADFTETVRDVDVVLDPVGGDYQHEIGDGGHLAGKLVLTMG